MIDSLESWFPDPKSNPDWYAAANATALLEIPSAFILSIAMMRQQLFPAAKVNRKNNTPVVQT